MVLKWSPGGHHRRRHRRSRLVWSGHENMIYIGINAQNLYIYIGINAHVTPAHRHTDGNVKVEQYSAEAESAKHLQQVQTVIQLQWERFWR